MTDTTSPTEVPKFAAKSLKDCAAVANDIFLLIEKEYRNGNLTITKDKYEALVKLRQDSVKLKTPSIQLETSILPALPYPPIYYKLSLPRPNQNHSPHSNSRARRSLSFKKIESVLIAVLEAVANLLENLHLFSKMPFFPKLLLKILKHTNRLWILILLFLIRKIISQLLNVIRKEKKVMYELSILKGNTNSKLLKKTADKDRGIFERYEKLLNDLKFDKLMLLFELLGDLMDLAFNVIELYSLPIPEWVMTSLNLASMAMTVYRMNKDDEYKDDDISQDII